MRVAGIMSGTSLDGIDVAIVDIARDGFKVAATRHAPYPKAVRAAILAVSNANTHTAAISALNFQLGELYATAFLTCCMRGDIAPDSVKLIGCHGQTIYHDGMSSKYPNTLQIGEAAVIAERTGIDVVSNFRERDIAAGGQGAPLVPLFDYLLFLHPKRGRIALNLGGIANITAIPAGAAIDDVVAFDTGPANMIIDQLAARHTGGKKAFDRNGAIGRAGMLNEPLLRRLLADPYFKRKPPKSAGREQYGVEFVDKLIATGIALPDLIATATHLTAESVAMAVRGLGGRYEELIAGGGGAHNGFLMELLQKTSGFRLRTTAEFGVETDFKEAAAFALLAWRTVNRKPGNVRTATGAKRAVILGKLTRA
jgi:anhydro-N-acetylmuramic acid kinase